MDAATRELYDAWKEQDVDAIQDAIDAGAEVDFAFSLPLGTRKKNIFAALHQSHNVRIVSCEHERMFSVYICAT